MRLCPFHLCYRTIPEELFSCRQHWYKLTEEERRRITLSYRAYQADEITVETLRSVQQEILGRRGTA